MAIKLINDTCITIRISTEEKVQLQKIAILKGTTISQLVRNLAQIDQGND